jgi:predicted metalloprotease with PDZ domain
MQKLPIRALVRLVCSALPFAAPALSAQPSAPVEQLRYEVLAGTAQLRSREFVVSARFTVAGPEPVLLSLPAWTPGSYSIENYARLVGGFTATQDGQPIVWGKRDPDTWRLVPRGRGTVEVRYRVKADAMDVSGSWTAADFGFFNGTNLLPFVEGRLDTPSRLVVRTEPAWRVATELTDADSAGHFRATDYHDLVDHPVFVGRFDLDSAMVAGKWMRVATWPVGKVAGPRRAAMWDALSRATESLVAVFGDVPWERYTVLQVVAPEFGGMSALEHSDSELAIVGEPFLDADFVMSIHAHELAHAWNVKRLRPEEMVPYRYDIPQPTRWLWVSEGITDYYADLALVRGGTIDEAQFLALTLGKIESVNGRPPTSLEDASFQTWLGMRDGTGDLYYDKGSLAGLALDIQIRDMSDNGRSLDDVMREIYNGTYKAGRGFTHDDFWNAVARATGGRAFGDFERRYISGRDAFAWNEILPRAGWRLVLDTISEPRLGAQLEQSVQGARVVQVDKNGMGGKADLRAGDVITHIGGRAVGDETFGAWWRDHWGRRAGATVPIVVRRAGQTVTLSAVVEVLSRTERRVEPDPSASPKAQWIRAGILRGRALAP